ncbi:uncharacterized protein LOC144086583 [Stigmatopora argus]
MQPSPASFSVPSNCGSLDPEPPGRDCASHRAYPDVPLLYSEMCWWRNVRKTDRIAALEMLATPCKLKSENLGGCGIRTNCLSHSATQNIKYHVLVDLAYYPEKTLEVKQGCGWLLLGWETALEYRVLEALMFAHLTCSREVSAFTPKLKPQQVWINSWIPMAVQEYTETSTFLLQEMVTFKHYFPLQRAKKNERSPPQD